MRWNRSPPPSPPWATSCGPSSRRGAPTCRQARTCCGPSPHPFDAVRVLIVGQDPYPTPGHAVGLSLLGRAADPADPAQPAEHLPRVLRRPRPPDAEHRRPVPLGGAGRPAAQPGAHRAARQPRLAPRQGLGGRDRAGHPGARRPRRPAGRDPLGPGCRNLDRCSARRRASPRRTRARCRPTAGFFGSRPFSRANALLDELGAEARGLAAAVIRARLAALSGQPYISSTMTGPRAIDRDNALPLWAQVHEDLCRRPRHGRVRHRLSW